MPGIILIDDKQPILDGLSSALAATGLIGETDIAVWCPSRSDPGTDARLQQLLDTAPELVVVDYDLTSQGQTGFFGSTVVAECQRRAIPVGDYSRGNPGRLPHEPDLFEFRVPDNDEGAAPFIVSVLRGFRQIDAGLREDQQAGVVRRSPAASLAAILGDLSVESQLSQYAVKVGATSSALFQAVARTAPADIDATPEEKRRVLRYIIGHLLLNSVLRFPGPILSSLALASYLGISRDSLGAVQHLFEPAKYSGPFSVLDSYFWLTGVDGILAPLLAAVPTAQEVDTPGERNRLVLENTIGSSLTRPSCTRCHGQYGGFLCPFTSRTVCQHTDCSVGSSSWIPAGAFVARIERDFYDEWAPILGI